MRLLPGAAVLARGAGELQVGLGAPLVLRGLDDTQRRFVADLEAGRATDHEARRHGHLVAALDAHGLLEPRSLPSPRVRVHDHGAIGIAIVAALSRAGCRSGFVPDPEPLGDGTTRSWRATREVRRLAPSWVALASHVPCDVDVLVGLGATPPLAATLLARDAAHLIVTADERGITVGPAVTPGRTPCGTCADLARADEDPGWPSVALQCATRAAAAPPDCVEPAAALVAYACRALIAQHDSDVAALAGARRPGVWRVSATGDVTVTPSSPHPRCRCGAAGGPGDEVAAQRARMP